MTDKDLSDKIRKLAARFRQQMEPHTPAAECEVWERAAEAVEALLPAPPTLADMTPEERAACQWMQADTELWGRVVIVLHNAGGGRAVTLNREGHMAYEDHGTITPLPALPRMTWPGDQEVEDVAPAKIDDMIESADDPRLAALPAGSTVLDRDGDTVTKKENGEWIGFGHHPNESSGNTFGPWQVVYIPKGADQ